MLNAEVIARLEAIADELEALARIPNMKTHRLLMEAIAPKVPTDLYALAWNLKQIARFGTPSFGV